MKTREQVDADKLRGGFYTPDTLVQHAYRRVSELLGHAGATHGLRLLEPSAGDGAFLRGLADSELRERVDHVTAIEFSAKEAESCQRAMDSVRIPGEVLTTDFVCWQEETEENFDVAVGNPPFVRFQFLHEEMKECAADLADSLGIPVRRVSNLWIPVLVGSLNRLKPGGVFSFVVPAECFTGVSAGGVREWLLREFADLTVDLFPPKRFPGVLQEVVILSGKRKATPSSHGRITLVDDIPSRSWTHVAPTRPDSWTRYLLTPAQLDAFHSMASLAPVRRLDDVAKFEVAAVTGANRYFSVSDDVVDEYGLGRWAVPLLPRIRHAPGLVYTQQDHKETSASGARAALLDFSSSRPNPESFEGAADYIEIGEAQGLHRRYKTRIRQPWYRVPLVRSEPLMMSKRSHHFPRVVLNEAEAVTTDTIYRGWVVSPDVSSEDFVAGFHNSLTLLTAEIEGRSFGGGVLELVPSEISRLCVPAIVGLGDSIDVLDGLARGLDGDASPDRLVEGTNDLLVKADVGFSANLLADLESARRELSQRRFSRNGGL